jgi:hypothetical protein
MRVFLGNLSFANLDLAEGRLLTPHLREVTPRSGGSQSYFPERWLAEWLAEHDQETSIYCFARTGVRPLREAYRALADELDLDAVILVDGGTDSLMRGDEAGLGTPEEDIASIAAVDALEGLAHRSLLCLGFGVDHYHGVCHAQFLEAVAELTASGGFLGAWSLLPQMPEVRKYRDAVVQILERIDENAASIVSASIVSAVDGRYGDYHMTRRTAGSRLWINPLMTFYWAFELDAVARRVLYLDQIRDTSGWFDLQLAVRKFRAGIEARDWEEIPV